ncbi:peptidoglycan DD-metalloendopeptidase family protein [Labilibaculum sp. DW002]|uniref:Peptidoglycan DD-metalloendopeptidase family protein n=1 Tax=Paralabilibaculum antarcticum TaxID=2912572 RepID=A0ABT5VXM6_9BACT|nr:peptidoglycan DD-metalloendopeptidase family protein [Labilibaculum sp. DW002]MDE5420169.1 peptidoglycan DD-metalloendopeptidase family protein [Labilibaculum sp. DW002]
MKKFFNYKFFLIAGAVLLGLIVLKWLSKENQVKEIAQETVVIDTTEKEQIHLKYGFPIEEFNVETNRVKRNHSLSTILRQYDVSFGTIDKIARKAKKVFNVRRIKSGHEYSVLFTKDSLKTPEYFVYENTPVEYIVFDLRDTLNVFKGEKEIVKHRRQIKGTIESSLWNAMVDAGADPVLSMELSDIYAWTIDFFGIGKGDEFNVIYDEEMIDGESIHQIDVIAANFVHHKSNNYAFAFTDGEKGGYFDEEGKSLQKAFLKAPLRFSRISSKFSNRRFHPVLKRYRAHHGIDYAAPTGTPVMTIGDGVIVKRGFQKRGGGRYLKVKHNSVYTTTYMHFSRFGKNVSVGSRVKQGQVIGYVGATGLATGPHLDFRVHKNGKAINPLRMKSPPVSPVKKENEVRYQLVMESLMKELNKEEAITLE